MATSWRNKKNYPLGVGSLNADIDASTLTIVLNSGQGANFPSATFTVSIDEEIILIDSRSTDTLTVNASGRGYDSSTASAHAASTGVYQYQIVKDFTDLETAVNGIENGTTTLAKVIASGSAANTFTVDDSGTNTVVSVMELYHTSSGTPASGLGAKLGLGAENSAGTSKTAAEIQGYLTTVTNGSEDGAFKMQVRVAGTLQDALTVTGGSNSATVGSGQTTATLWNTTATTVNAFGAATAVTIGATTGTMTLQNATVRMLGGTFQSTDSAQFLISHAPASGTALVRFYPAPVNTSTAAAVDFFRATNTTTTCEMILKKGDNTNTNIVRFLVGASPQTRFNDASGTAAFTFTHSSGDLTMTGDLAVNGGDLTTSATTFNLVNATATTVNFAGAASTATNIGNASGTITLRGQTAIGSASTDLCTMTSRLLVRSVTDAGPMTATPGTQREIVYNTSDSKFYGCTVTHGTAATWVALN